MERKRLLTLSDVSLYVVTSGTAKGNEVERVQAALAGGADMVQLREKNQSTRDLVDLCRHLQAACDKTGALFLVNDRVDVAVAANTDGVHLGQSDLPLETARDILGHQKLLGASTHSVEQALAAQTQGADYVSCGPLFATPTKPSAPAIGLEAVRQYGLAVRIPFVAIGGIDSANVEEVVRLGADRVAVVRAVFEAPDVEAAVRDLKEKVVKARQARINHQPGSRLTV